MFLGYLSAFIQAFIFQGPRVFVEQIETVISFFEQCNSHIVRAQSSLLKYSKQNKVKA